MGTTLRRLFRYHEDPLSWSISRQGVAHRLFQRIRSIIIDFLEYRGTITADVYCETMQSLRRSIKNKRQQLLTEGEVLLHDNAHAQVSKVTHVKRAKFKWKQFEHPPYSSDMSPCDFYVFAPLKKHMKGQRFNSVEELKDAVKD